MMTPDDVRSCIDGALQHLRSATAHLDSAPDAKRDLRGALACLSDAIAKPRTCLDTALDHLRTASELVETLPNDAGMDIRAALAALADAGDAINVFRSGYRADAFRHVIATLENTHVRHAEEHHDDA